ncbi:MAG: ThiF family adenylyltransferase [Pseudomonadota bacterium]|nr:ThiF family adenylyltransferase [Pseudomonadota bacterium]
MQIDGNTGLIAHLGSPTHSFKAPMIYNPYFESAGINAVVMPMGCTASTFAQLLPLLFRLDNIRGALITMPHKVSVIDLLDEVTPAAQIAGACNAVKRDSAGRLVGDQFDGEGFVRGVRRKGLAPEGARALVVGCGGVGSAIAASLALARVRAIALFDIDEASAQALARRLQVHYPDTLITLGSNDPKGLDLVVNATPLGMKPGDAMPVDVSRLDAHTFVGEVVMAKETTALLQAAQSRGCRVQVGADMLFEMIPPYLEFFGFPSTTPERLRALARIEY